MALQLAEPEAPEKENRREDEIDARIADDFNPETRARLQELRGHDDAIAARAGLNNEIISDDIQKQEESKTLSGPWADKTAPKNEAPRQKGIKGIAATAKKRGPLGILLTVLIGGAVGVSFLTPGLLLIHVTETLTDALNMQLPSLDIRANKILTKKISNQALTGVCTQPATFRCKFNSLNDRQLKALRAAGIEVTLQENTTITGRHKPASMKYGDIDINPENLNSQLRQNEQLRSAFKSAYNSKFASVVDAKARTFLTNRGVPLGPPFQGATNDEARTTKVQDVTKNGATIDSGGDRYSITTEDGKTKITDKVTGDDVTDSITEDAAKSYNESANTGANELAANSKDIADTNKKSGTAVLDELANNPGDVSLRSKIANKVSVVGFADNACTLYGMAKAVSFGAKAVRAVQMMRFAGIFLTTASMIKAGDATPEDVSYVSSLLTETVNQKVTDKNNETKTITTKAATDSYGYKYAAYGDTGPLSASATQFLAGGGLGGELSGIISSVTSIIGGRKNADTTCKVIRNPWVSGGSIVLGVVSLIGPGWLFKAGQEVVLTGIEMYLTEKATTVLPAMLQDIVAGVLIDDQTFGEPAGDALVSGTGAMMSGLAAVGGNAPLTAPQAVAYKQEQNRVLAQYAAEDRQKYGLFDASNPNTFMGRIVAQLIPYSSQAASLSGFISTSTRVATRSLASVLTPTSFAQTVTLQDYTICEDPDYRDIGLATDPFCNPIRGIPSNYLQIDPDEIIDTLIVGGHIDEQSGTPKGDVYPKFISNCIERENPLGDTGVDGTGSDGTECFIDNKGGIDEKLKAFFYIYQIDLRVIDGMENGYVLATSGSTRKGGGARISEVELLALLEEYSLGDYTPKADGIDGWEGKLKQLTDNPKASWAAESMLAGEKNFMDKGGSIKEYLNTAWLWVESGGGSWPDPYQVNCTDLDPPTRWQITRYCNPEEGSGLMQVGGYQMWERNKNLKEEYERFYSSSELISIMDKVIQNSVNASKEEWSYSTQSSTGVVGKYLGLVSSGSVTMNDIAGDVQGDEKTQFLTTLLGKDPNIVTALNSYAVTDEDLITQIKKPCLYDDCDAYGAAFKQLLSNLIYALWKFDSMNSSAGDTVRGGGAGLSAIWGGSGTRKISFGFDQAPSADSGASASWYDHGKNYGMGGITHTGTDILGDPYSPIYSPVKGVVVCAGNGNGTNDTPMGCSGANDYSLDTTWEQCVAGKDNSRRGGYGTVIIRITDGNDKPTGDYLLLGHLAEGTVTLNQKISPNDQVGAMGCMNGWHVHVEAYVRDESLKSTVRLVDPVKYLGGGD